MYDFKVQNTQQDTVSLENAAATPIQKKVSAVDYLKPIQKKSENNTGLPDNIKSGVENMSGVSLDDVKVHYNSSKPTQMKALAYTQGSDIHVAPGQEQHLGHEAWHVVQQKQGRVQPTTQMKGLYINDNPSLEHEADVMGAKAAQFKSLAPVIQQKPAGGDSTIQFWNLTNHKKITKQGAELAGIDNNDKETLKGLEKGSVFNDIGARNERIINDKKKVESESFIGDTGWGTIKFIGSYFLERDSFLNESHHGGMQFLHTMNNDQAAEENTDQQLEWAKFCLQSMNEDVQDQSLLKFIMSKGHNKLFDMLMPMMVETTGFFKKRQAVPFKSLDPADKGRTLTPHERSIIAFQMLGSGCTLKEATGDVEEKKSLKGKPSKMANMTVGEFFSGEKTSKKGYSAKKTGWIAIGSMLHMIEDSFASSHSQRTINLKKDWFNAVNSNALNRKDIEQEITSRLTPIMLHANYNSQDTTLHGKADSMINKSIQETQGAAQARVVVGYILKKIKDNEAVLNGTDPSPSKNAQDVVQEILDFINKVLAVDDNATNKAAVKEANGIQDNVTFETTKGGRQFEITDWMENEPNQDSRSMLEEYGRLLEPERQNIAYNLNDRISTYQKQLGSLHMAYFYSESIDTKKTIKRHISEMLFNVLSMKKQLSQQQPAELDALKDLMVSILNESEE